MTVDQAHLIHTFEHRAYPLDKHGLRIGRDSDNDVVIREVTVSRQHAEIYRDGDDYILHGTGSTGVLVNTESVDLPYTLQEGDRVTIGTMTFAFTRGALPVGITIIDRSKPEYPETTVEMKRPTITNPILPRGKEIEEPKSRAWLWILLTLAVIIALILRDWN